MTRTARIATLTATRTVTLTDKQRRMIDWFCLAETLPVLEAKRQHNKEYTLHILSTDRPDTEAYCLLRTRDHKLFWAIVAQANALMNELRTTLANDTSTETARLKALVAIFTAYPPQRSDTDWCAELPVATSPQPVQPSKTLVHIEKRVASITYIATAPDFAVRGVVAPMGRGL